VDAERETKMAVADKKKSSVFCTPGQTTVKLKKGNCGEGPKRTIKLRLTASKKQKGSSDQENSHLNLKVARTAQRHLRFESEQKRTGEDFAAAEEQRERQNKNKKTTRPTPGKKAQEKKN